MISIRENMLKVYHHEIPDFLPLIEDIQNIATVEPGFSREIYKGEKSLPLDVDWFGQEWILEPNINAYNPNVNNYIIEDMSEWRKYITIPDPDSVDWKSFFDKKNIVVNRNKVVLIKDGFGLWERAFSMVPIVDLLCSLLTDPEACKDFFGAVADYKIKMHNYYIEYYNPDILLMHDDYGSGQGLFMSPDTWRELIKPHLQRVIDNIRDHGVIYEHHCCGILRPLCPEIAEMGADAWENVHVANDPVACKAEFGDKLAFIGGVGDTQYLDSDNRTEDEIRNSIRKTMDEMLPGVGTVIYIACKAHPERKKFISNEIYNYGQQFFKEKRPDFS